jgi:hypothetical protein
MAVPPRDKTAGRSLRGVPQVPVVRPSPPRAPVRPPPTGSSAPSTLSLVIWPAILTLGVTLLRLVGELRGWSPAYFSRLPGGGLAIVGITWLVPLVGAYLGFRLTRAGASSPGVASVAGWPAGALALGLGIGYGLERIVQPSWTGTLALWAMVAVFVALMSFVTWPALGWPLLLYAFAARLPVALLMGLAIRGRWGTHYDVPPPGFPGLFPMARWLWTGLLPQTTIWIAFTLAVGMCGAAAGVWVASRIPAKRAEPGPRL